MGIENRDYYRSSGYDGWRTSDTTPAVKYLIIANIIVFLLQIFTVRQPTLNDTAELRERYRDMVDRYSDEPISEDELLYLASQMPPRSIVTEWLQLETNDVVRRGQIWRLVTSAFCHDRHGIFHILFNMLFLYWFGRHMERMYGTEEFVWFYFTAAVIASAAYIGLDLVTGDARPAIGASGAVMGVTVLYAIHFPYDRIYLFMLIPIEVRWLVLIYIIFDVHPVLLALAGDAMHTGVAHAAHLGGAAFGFGYWRFRWRLSPIGDRLRGWLRFDRTVGPRRNIRLHKPSVEEREEFPGRNAFDDEVDAVLQKITEEGESSLTERERELLAQASKRYRRKGGPR